MTSRFAAMRVRPAHGYRHAEEGEEPQWLLLEWLAGQAGPSRQWLSTLPPSTDLASLVRMVKIRWWIEQGYQQLKDELGLDHYEGRRWQGWHHHVTLTMMAFAFLALERLRAKKNFWVALATADDSGVTCGACWPSGPAPAAGVALPLSRFASIPPKLNVVVLAGC